MKLSYAYLLLLCWLPLGAKEAQELFLEANQLYEQKNYKEALVRYRAIKNKGSAVYYNLGNTLLHLNKFTEALIAYHRAERDATGAQLNAITRSITTVQEHLGLATQQSFWTRATQQVGRLPFLLLQFVLVMLWIVFLWRFWYWYERKQFGCIIVLAVALSIGAGLVVLKYHRRFRTTAVIVAKQEGLRVGPHEKFHTRSTVRAGDWAMITSAQMGKETELPWYRAWCNGHSGWIRADKIEVI